MAAESGQRASNAYVQDLLNKIQAYERHSKERSVERRNETAPDSDSSRRIQSGPHQDRQITSDFGKGLPSNGKTNQPTTYSGIDASTSPTAGSLASGPAFESQARTLLNYQQKKRSFQTPVQERTGSFEPSSHNESEPVLWNSIKDLTEDLTSFTLPSEQESRRLLELFLLYLGANQHFLDSRNFSDSLTLLYRSPVTRQRLQASTWFTQYLLIMAMGKLMDSSTGESQHPPGADLFAEATRRLPPLHRLGEHGVISVEILAAVALYLQWCDRRHEAYFYIGIAMRLAIALRCSLPTGDQECLPSEASHRLRLWWTVFMLDRRLSAGLGLPVGADDRQIRTELPQSSAGFESHVPLVINIQIARATGDIISSLYGNLSMSQDDLVHKIQSILESLYDTGRSIPPEFGIDFSRSPVPVTRTGASLYLMLFQAIILCVRPVILQCVRQNAQNPGEQNNQTYAPVILRLCKTCDEAARKSLRILHALQQNNIIARFGFFDLDATFAAAFILVMLGSMDNKTSAKPPMEMRLACEVLCYLSSAGNKAAVRRLNDVTQFCSNVWPSSRLPTLPNADATRSTNNGAGRDETVSARLQGNPGYPEQSSAGVSDHTSSDSPGTWMGMTQFDVDNINFDLGPEADDIYWSFNDPNFPVTGVDYSDWLQMENFFAGRYPASGV